MKRVLEVTNASIKSMISGNRFEMHKGYFHTTSQDYNNLVRIIGIRISDIISMSRGVRYFVWEDNNGVHLSDKCDNNEYIKNISNIFNMEDLNIFSNNRDIDSIIDLINESGICSTIMSRYGEPGYSDPEKDILFGDWNLVSTETIQFIEECGYATEWYDEWVHDYDGGFSYRNSQLIYFGNPSYMITDSGEVFGIANINEYIEEYIDYLKYDWIPDGDIDVDSDCFEIDFLKHGLSRVFVSRDAGGSDSGAFYKSVVENESVNGFSVLFQDNSNRHMNGDDRYLLWRVKNDI